jgi:hypothetical protein
MKDTIRKQQKYYLDNKKDMTENFVKWKIGCVHLCYLCNAVKIFRSNAEWDAD